jgi:ferritin
MLSPEVEAAMNAQIAAELYSSHLYLAMSTACESDGLPGLGRWFALQADEERDHALRFVRHVLDRGGRVVLTGLDAPPTEFGGPLGAFEQALTHEMNVTQMIDGLYGMALQHGDYASQVFLQWFVTEQVEEEKTATEIVQTLKAVGHDPIALMMFDRELGASRAEGAGG